MKAQKIEDTKLDELLNTHRDENISWDRNKIIIDGILYYRKSICTDEKQNNKMTATSLIKAEPAFDYSFMDDVYSIIDEHKIEHIRYPRAKRLGVNHERDCRYQIDLHAAYPHILANEKLPIDGALYEDEDINKLNFYKVVNCADVTCGSIVTNDLASYIKEHGDEVEYLFSTDYKIGSKMGERLLTQAYKNEKTKAEVKQVHYGYYQKKYIQYIPNEDAYVKNPKYNHELLMIAVTSQLCYIMLHIAEFTGSPNGRFVVDAYHFRELDIDRIKQGMQQFPKYDYRIYDTWTPSTEDKHGVILYKTYKDIPKAPRSHHKKK